MLTDPKYSNSSTVDNNEKQVEQGDEMWTAWNINHFNNKHNLISNIRKLL
jgi:hypothetical protein